MAAPTYSWNTITAGQTDGDSPLDETLMDGIRENLIHLEEWMGDGFTAAKDHDHDGVNSKSVVLADGVVVTSKLDALAVTEAKLGNNSIVQGKLNTSESEVSRSATSWSSVLTLAGGNYGFYPALKYVSNNSVGAHILEGTGNAITTGYVAHIMLWGDQAWAKQIYMDSSPPYDLGNGEIPMFIYALINNSTGKIESTYVASAPPWAYNGPRHINPNKIIIKKGKKYLRRKQRPWTSIQAREDKTKLLANIKAMKNPIIEEIEITTAMKNLGMPDIPSPFIGINAATHTAILLDPCSSLCLDLAELSEESPDGVSEITDLLNGGNISFENTQINGLITPPGVMGVKMRLS